MTAGEGDTPRWRWITVRQYPSGAGLLDAAGNLPSDVLRTATSILLLIHGYNVSVPSAVRAYGAFREHLDAGFDDMLAGVFWPGDAIPFRGLTADEPPVVSTVLSALTYPEQLSAAKLSARRFS